MAFEPRRLLVFNPNLGVREHVGEKAPIIRSTSAPMEKTTKQFRPRLKSKELGVLCEVINSEVDRLVKIYDEKRKTHSELAFKLMEVDELNFDKDPEYQKLGLELERIRQKVLILEEIELQFRSLLKNKTTGRRVVMRPWLSRIWHTGMDV